ncbi:MAG: hypothetical protein M1835_002029 [Candelina submexicana]|nr:MAG: hypothetical protein M1835_002029 [Candelina submexicana]
MSRFGGPRSSAGNLGYDDDRGGQRWDPERFSRERDRIERYGRQVGQDRDRFEDYGRRFGGDERDRFDRFDRFDRSGGDNPRRGGRGGGGGGGGGRRRDSSADDLAYGRRDSRGGRGDGRFEEKIIIDEKFGRPNRRQPAYLEEDRDSFEGSPSRSMVPFNRNRRQSITVDKERDFGPPARRPARPGFLRRQSSLDTFDRRPMPRYGREVEREIIPIPVPRKPRRSPPRRAPPRRYEERDFEEIRIAEPDYYGDEEFREFRERDIIRDRRRSTSRFRVPESVGGFSDDDDRDDFEPERQFPRRGKTRMPKRIVSIRAVVELGYPYEEEHDTIIIQKALGKEHIDEIIRVSKELKESGGAVESRTTYMIEAPPAEPLAPPPPPQSVHSFHPPPPPQSIHSPPPPPQPEVITLPPPPPPEVIYMPAPGQHQPEIVERRTEIITSPPPPPPSNFSSPPPPPVMPMPVPMDHQVPESVANWDVISHHSNQPPPRHRSHSQGAQSHQSHHTSRRRSHSRRRKGDREVVAEKEESNKMGFPLSLALPDRRKNEQDIKAEIRALELEKKALKQEREADKHERKADRYREAEYSTERRDSGSVKIEKDRKGRLSMVR